MQNSSTLLKYPPNIQMDSLKNVFIQVSSNKKTSSVKKYYIKKDEINNKEEFIAFEKVKKALYDLSSSNLNSIYLMGYEPMSHPDFNNILRSCLKLTNVTILTNGTMINDKKARFLRKIDDESKFETIYRINLDSVNETQNDSIRGRGSFRKSIGSIISLIKYEFNPIVSVINYQNACYEQIFQEFKNYFSSLGFEFEKINLKVIPNFTNNINSLEKIESDKINKEILDCYSSRILSNSGIYSCPILVNDYRARLGSSFEDYSKNNYLDCDQCAICVKTSSKIYVNDWM